MIRRWFNQITRAAVLYIEDAKLMLFLADGTQIDAQEVKDLPSFEKQPILLVINPFQFLQVHHHLQHLYLTTWQQDILRQLLASSYVIRSIVFLPRLLEKKRESKFARIFQVSNRKYLEVSQDDVMFWKQLQQEDHLQELHEVSLYLRRYHVDFKGIKKEQSLVTSCINHADLIITVMRKSSHSLHSDRFLLIEKLMLKQKNSRRYVVMTAGSLAFSGGCIMAGLFFLILSIQTFFNHNPWKLIQPVRMLAAEERAQLLQFKSFLTFYPRSILFSPQSLKTLFQKFSGKIVATDLVWENKRWDISFIVNPAFIAQIPDIKEWIGHHLKNSKLSESESAIHQYTLRFNSD